MTLGEKRPRYGGEPEMSNLSVGIVGPGSVGMGIAKNALKAGLSVKELDAFENARSVLDAGE